MAESASSLPDSLSSSSSPFMDSSSSSSSSIDLLDPFGLLLTLQCLISLVLNLTALTTYFKDARLRADGSSALLLNLLAADLGITLCGCPFSALAAFYGEWPFGELGCTLYGFQVFGTTRQSCVDWAIQLTVFKIFLRCEFFIFVFPP